MTGHESEQSLYSLSPQDISLLHEVLIRQRPNLLGFLTSLGRVPLTEEQRTDLRLAVTDELVNTGFTDQDEPNSRGLQLEALIDKLGHL
jgi:hypothetical protein